MKKIILTLVAIMMVTMSSVSMASNKGKHNNGNCKEISIEAYGNYRNNGRGHNKKVYVEYNEYNNRDNRDYYDNDDRYEGREYRDRDYRDRDRRDRDDRCNERRHHHRNSDAKTVGTILGVASLILLATSH
nr:hypothetical protein [uncultured Bacteroides sp.]